jgi:hypothetical protein
MGSFFVPLLRSMVRQALLTDTLLSCGVNAHLEPLHRMDGDSVEGSAGRVEPCDLDAGGGKLVSRS